MKERWIVVACCALLLPALGSVARTTPQQNQGSAPENQDSSPPVRIAPPPADPYELVTSQPITTESPEEHDATAKLLLRAIQKKHAFGVPFNLKVTFRAAGQVQEVGPGEMDEISTDATHRHWEGRVGNFSMTRIITNRAYDSVPPGAIPIRLQMVRANVEGPMPASTWGEIRTAKAALNGSLVTCLLTSVHGSDAPGRDWSEIEYCLDSQSGFLRVFSAAPGSYVFYDYPNPAPPRHTVPYQFTVVEAGEVVLQGTISAEKPARNELDPSVFTPTSGMFTGGVGLTVPTYQIMSRGKPAAGTVLQPVVIHANLAPDGSVVEAESLQPGDDALNQSALELVKKTKFRTTYNYGYPEQQEIFVTVE